MTWDHGLRLWLKSAASSRLPLESLLVGKALGGETKISYRPFCPSSNGERNPKTKSEDDAVGAPRLVFRRWGQDLIRPFRHPTAPKRQAPMGRGCRRAVGFHLGV